MAELILFHHSQGLTDGLRDFAESLRRAGHTVHTPDAYDGHTFATLDEGMSYAREVGFDTVAARGVEAADALGTDLVYAGVSLGVVTAQQLAQTRDGAKGALFIDACMPVEEFSAGWPDGVPVQIHGKESDPYFAEEGGDIDAARALVAATDQAELFLYPGNTHLWLDQTLPGYDRAATESLTARTIDFLGRLD